MPNKILGYCFSAIRTIPVIFITAVVVWSYYAYVIQMCLFTVDSIPEKVLYLVFYHPLLIMFLWSFWKTIFTPIALPPYEYDLGSSEQVTHDLLNSDLDRKKVLNNFGRSLGVQCRLVTGDVRFCEKCNSIKPDRAHHCSVCGKCILKLDHHCPWVNNCICFSNYKFFFLFLAYGLLYCLYVFATTVKYFVQFWSGISTLAGTGNLSNLHIVFLFFASVMFFISLVALLSYHCYLVALNRTTIESFQVPMFTNGVQDCHAFSLGFRANFREVFGDDPRLWFLPIFSSFGDGLKYPTRFVPLPSNYNTMDSALNIGHANLGHSSLDSTPTVIDMYSTSDLVNGKEVIQSENDDTNRLLREGSNHGSINGGISVTNYPGMSFILI